MKTKLFVTVLLSVIGLLLVVGGTSHAQPLYNHQPINQQIISNTVYLPIIKKPMCAYVPHAELFASVNKPVVKVGEIMTLTGVLVNDCTPVMLLRYYMNAQQGGVISPSSVLIHDNQPVNEGSYGEITFTPQAVGAGVVTVTIRATYATFNPASPNIWFFDYIAASPIVMRVLP